MVTLLFKEGKAEYLVRVMRENNKDSVLTMLQMLRGTQR